MDDDVPHTDDGFQLQRIRVLEDGLVEADETLDGMPLWLDVTEIHVPEIRELVEKRFGITLTKEVA